MEATNKKLTTRDDLSLAIADLRVDIANMKYELSNKIGHTIKWMFIFWIAQVGATLAIVLLLRK